MTYSVVVESGSCDQKRRYWEERENCGHQHKTWAAADKCRQKLTRRYCRHGRYQGQPCSLCIGPAKGENTSAQWYNARIHNQDRERVDDDGITAYEYQQQMAEVQA